MKVAQHKKAAGILMGAIGWGKDFQMGAERAMDRDLAAGRIDAASSGLWLHVVVVVCVAVLLSRFDVVDRDEIEGGWGGS